MEDRDWQYETATDHGLSFMERLKQCPREPDPFIYAARFLSAVAIRAAMKLYNRFTIVGREHLSHDGSFVLVANHESHLDAIALLCALPLRTLHRAYPLAACDYFGANRLRLAISVILANAMLFNRNVRGVEEIKLCQRMLDERDSIFVIFPEGTRSVNGSIGLFRRGIGRLVAGTSYPVVPCYLDGTANALQKGGRYIRPARLRLIIGEARTYEQIAQNDAGVRYICADLRQAVLALAPATLSNTTPEITEEVYL
jgi:1-acyl-sn-glycerol-3-phosphate acyltransferase